MNIALYRLMAGFKKFREKYFLQKEVENSIYHRLASSGQTPKILLIGCSDSRVDPAIMTGANPGDLFVIRNVANLVPPFEPSAHGFRGTSSAIEFAIIHLKVDNVIVLGHRQCGGIRALMRGPAEGSPSFINQWMSIAEAARVRVLAEYGAADEESRCRMAEMESIKVSLKNLRSFPFVHDAIKTRNLNVIGVYFDLEQGKLWELDEAKDQFRPLEL